MRDALVKKGLNVFVNCSDDHVRSQHHEPFSIHGVDVF
jgi:hypothetical protein